MTASISPCLTTQSFFLHLSFAFAFFALLRLTVVHKSTGTDTFTMLSSFTGTPLPNNPKRGRTSKKKKKKLHIKLYCAVYSIQEDDDITTGVEGTAIVHSHWRRQDMILVPLTKSLLLLLFSFVLFYFIFLLPLSLSSSISFFFLRLYIQLANWIVSSPLVWNRLAATRKTRKNWEGKKSNEKREKIQKDIQDGCNRTLEEREGILLFSLKKKKRRRKRISRCLDYQIRVSRYYPRQTSST